MAATYDYSTRKIEEAVYFSLGMGSMSVDNPVGDPDWDNADVEIDI